MKYIPNEIRDEILARNNIDNVIQEFLPLERHGRNFRAICPFHNDSNPSLSIDINKQIYKCFVCLEGGNAIKFIMKYKNISYVDALKHLALKANMDFDFTPYSQNNFNSYNEEDLKTLELLEQVNAYYLLEAQICSNDSLVKKYFQKRNLDLSTRQLFSIGYAPNEGLSENLLKKDLLLLNNAGLINPENHHPFFNNRITFAIKNHNNEVVGFSARIFDDFNGPKYINSPESKFFKKNSILYNYAQAKEEIESKKQIVITEGFFDVIALHKANIKNAVCLMGTALTENHLPLLKNKEIILFLDGDTPGIIASLKSFLFLSMHKISTKIVINNTRKDPDEIYNSLGPNTLQKMLSEAILGIEFVYKNLIEKYNLILEQSNLEKIINFEKDFSKYLVFQNQSIQNFYIEKIKNKFNYEIKIEKHDLKDEIIKHDVVDESVTVSNNMSYKTIQPKIAKKNRDVLDSLKWSKWLLLVLVNCPELIPNFKSILKDKEKEIQLKVDNNLAKWSQIIIDTKFDDQYSLGQFKDLKLKINSLYENIINNKLFKQKFLDANENKILDFQDLIKKVALETSKIFIEEANSFKNEFLYNNGAVSQLGKKYFENVRETIQIRRNDGKNQNNRKRK